MNAPDAVAGAVSGVLPQYDFESLFLAQYDRIARVIARVTQDPGRAEELAVEVFLKLPKRAHAIESSVEGWLYRTAIRMSLDELRRRTRRERYERMVRWLRREPTPEELHHGHQERRHVQATLLALGARQASLLLLRADGLSYAEIATHLGLNPASVGTLLSRAHQSFKKEYLKQHGTVDE